MYASPPTDWNNTRAADANCTNALLCSLKTEFSTTLSFASPTDLRACKRKSPNLWRYFSEADPHRWAQLFAFLGYFAYESRDKKYFRIINFLLRELFSLFFCTCIFLSNTFRRSQFFCTPRGYIVFLLRSLIPRLCCSTCFFYTYARYGRVKNLACFSS